MLEEIKDRPHRAVFFEKVIENSLRRIIVLGAKNRVEHINKEAGNLLGIEPGELSKGTRDLDEQLQKQRFKGLRNAAQESMAHGRPTTWTMKSKEHGDLEIYVEAKDLLYRDLKWTALYLEDSRQKTLKERYDKQVEHFAGCDGTNPCPGEGDESILPDKTETYSSCKNLLEAAQKDPVEPHFLKSLEKICECMELAGSIHRALSSWDGEHSLSLRKARKQLDYAQKEWPETVPSPCLKNVAHRMEKAIEDKLRED